MSDSYEEIYDETNDIYDDEAVEGMEHDDEISPQEEGFMKGYNRAGKKRKNQRDLKIDILTKKEAATRGKSINVDITSK